MLQVSPSIEYLEMVPILLAVLVWGAKLRSKKVVFHTDNAGPVEAWAELRSSSPGVLDIMRRMTWVAATQNLAVTLKHVRGVDNGIADALSRFQNHRFRTLVPQANLTQTPCPDIFQSLHSTYQPTSPSKPF